MDTRFEVDFAAAISRFESAMKKFKLKKIIYKSIFRGKGLEFDTYRNFEADDDSTLIDWKASLRANRLLAKQYIEEREFNVYFVVDVSNSMLFGSRNKLKAEYSCEIAAVLGHLVLNSGDNLGLILFSDKVVKVLPPARSRNQFMIFMNYLMDFANYGGKSDVTKAVQYVRENVNLPFSVFIVISDFLHIGKRLQEELTLLSARFETMAVMVRDPMDESLPVGSSQLVVQHPSASRQMIVDPSIAAVKYQEIAMKQKEFAKELFVHSAVDLLELYNDKDFVMPIVSFFKNRAGGTGE